jgi:hypothetical protein
VAFRVARGWKTRSACVAEPEAHGHGFAGIESAGFSLPLRRERIETIETIET